MIILRRSSKHQDLELNALIISSLLSLRREIVYENHLCKIPETKLNLQNINSIRGFPNITSISCFNKDVLHIHTSGSRGIYMCVN